VQYSSAITNFIQWAAWDTFGNWTIKSADAVCVLNQRVHAWLDRRYPTARLALIGNGVDTLRFRPTGPAERNAIRSRLGIAQEQVVGLFVGRDVAKKNLDRLLDMPRKGFLLAICGAERNIQMPGIVDLGVVPYGQMADVYATADFMVLPSTDEGFPVAAQEAMASGIPLVLLWDEGYRLWLEPDVVIACTTFDELAARMRWLAEDPGARASIGTRARDWAVSHWHWAETVAQYERLYDEVLHERRRDDRIRRSEGPVSEQSL
jgi:glycosyltransferase involved in cell wall biosynthesis